MQQWGRWCSQAPMGGRYFRNKKKVHLPQDEKRLPRAQRPTHPPTTSDTVHPLPTFRPKLYYITQYSSAAVRTAVHLVRGEQLVDWFLKTLYETGNKRGEFHFLTIPGHLGERASRHPPPTNHSPTTHHPTTDLPSTAVQQCSRAIHLTGEQQPIRWLQCLCSRAGRDLQLFTIPRHAGGQSSRPREGGRFPRSPLAEVGHRRPFFRRHVVVLLCGWDVAAPRGRRRPSGAWESQLYWGSVITKIFSKIPKKRHCHDSVLYNKDVTHGEPHTNAPVRHIKR